MSEQPVALRFLADLVRVGAAVSVLATLVGIPSLGLGPRFLLVLLALLVPRAVGGVGARLDLVFSATLLAAAWTSTAEWYRTAWISWPVHAVATGVTAAVVYHVLAGRGLLGDAAVGATAGRLTVVGRVVGIGLVVGGVWEAYRWLEPAVVPAHPAADMAVHLLVDAAGALVAGLVLAGRGRCEGAHVDDDARGLVMAGDRRQPIL